MQQRIGLTTQRPIDKHLGNSHATVSGDSPLT